MKKLFALSLCMFMIAMSFVACDSDSNGALNIKFSADMDIKRYPLGADEPVAISEENKQIILDILNGGYWKDEVYDCMHVPALNIDGKIIEFSTDCGHFEYDGKTLTVKGKDLDSAKAVFGENFEFQTMPQDNFEKFKRSVEQAIEDKFGIENFTLSKIKVDTVDSPEHKSSRMAVQGTAGDNNEKWTKIFDISYNEFKSLYSSATPYVVFDADERVSSDALILVCSIIDRYEEK